MDAKNCEETGLATSEALYKLQNEIEQVLIQFKLSQKSRSWLFSALNHSSQHTTINWVSTLLLILSSFLFLFSYFIHPVTEVLIYQSVFILILTIISIIIEVNDNKLRHNEIFNRAQNLLQQLRTDCKNLKWVTSNYPHLLSPYSPCITLQWTYRDGKLVNLPWALLVKGDLILIRPGQIVPGYCEAVDKNSDFPLLHLKEVYGPSLPTANEFFSVAKMRKPLQNKKYRLLETPYLHNLRIALEQSLDRPITQYNQQRHLLMIKIGEQFIVPSVLVIIYVINFVRYMYLEHYIGSVHWIDSFVLVPVCTVLPLLPIIFPILWNLLNCYGMARFQVFFNESKKLQPTEEDFFEEEEDNKLSYPIVNCNWISIWKNFVKVFKGDGDILMRTANIVHVLGSITAFCCVDKKGVLSWPNPTAEKIFFLRNSDNVSRTSSLANLGELSADNDSIHDDDAVQHQPRSEDYRESSHAEVLDLTRDHKDPFKLCFDDMNWRKNISSLKPLGLAVLLNTCNLDTQEYYTQFCSHITCEAMYNENLVPVANRRCLCELAKEIGFSSDAQKAFSLEQQLSTYRHLQTEMVRRDNKYARSLQMQTKLKFPFPHMFAVIVKELSSGSTQLLSQGTADVILDSCVDYWDGQDLCTLTQADRKKIQDFYQRTSLTAYCTAFAYRPVNKAVNEKLGKLYLELPSDSRHLYLSHRSPSPIHWECRPVLEPKTRTPLGPFCSTDSLLCNGSPVSDISDADSYFEMQCNQVFIGMVTMQYQVISDMVHLIDQLEAACIRFVHFSKENELRSRVFSEKMGLESGWNCHISLLSDRSRRDSGPLECWANNGTLRVCSPDLLPKRKQHINRIVSSTTSDSARPLLDNTSNLDSSKMLSYSAPSAINVEYSVVKFEEEEKESNIREIESDDPEQPLQEIKNTTSQDSVQIRTVDLNTSHEWQSLSCLTDSSDQSAPINFDMSNRVSKKT
ncbi:transmembrane protein 94 isoform X2 [Agrilus planipennis]|uniref:Transmembrane protein 94 isoform X2 n=2 Tax=Agrilus planipennis TaxID=224129 RepID=A0A7F5RKV1_AGRPL|nr:transmembrane protein 94 isoform X2 [Agrilus planipennis]